jgi:hypothetical protein
MFGANNLYSFELNIHAQPWTIDRPIVNYPGLSLHAVTILNLISFRTVQFIGG